MVDDTPPLDSDDYDDLAALDFSAPGAGEDESDLDALGGYIAPLVDADDVPDDELPVPVFTVANPPGSVTVSVFMDGRVQHIDLAPHVTRMTETDLAEEVVVIAGLATQDARSAQYSFMLDGMKEQGHDAIATRDFLTRELDLPTPEQAEAARTRLFAERYPGADE